MSVLGKGVDIVKNLRIKKSIKNYNFVKRIYLTDNHGSHSIKFAVDLERLSETRSGSDHQEKT